VIAEPKDECDHDWEYIDNSFDHEFGCEQVVFERCRLCDVERDYEHESLHDDVI